MAASSDFQLELSPVLLKQRIEAFVTVFLEGKSPETLGTYRRSLNEFERWFARRKRPFGFRKKDVVAYRNYLTDERGLSPASVSTYLTALRRLCAYLVSTGELQENPAVGVKGNARPAGHSREVLTEAEVERLFEVVEGDALIALRDRALMALMIYVGLSEIELVRADCGDLDQTLLGLFLNVQGKGHTAKDQQVPIDGTTGAAIEAYLLARPVRTPEDPLFVSHGHRSDGARLNTRSVRGRIDHHLKAADLKRNRISPHSLTHTAALIWLNGGMSIEQVRRRMRHGTLETTMISLRKKGRPTARDGA